MPKPAPNPVPKPKPIPRPKPIRRHSPSNRLQVPSTPSNNFTSPSPSSYFTAQESLPQSELVVPSPEYPPPWYGFSDNMEGVQGGEPSDDAEKGKGKRKRKEEGEVDSNMDEMEDQDMHDANMSFLNSTPREGDGGDLGPEIDADYEPGSGSPPGSADEALSDDDDDDEADDEDEDEDEEASEDDESDENEQANERKKSKTTTTTNVSKGKDKEEKITKTPAQTARTTSQACQDHCLDLAKRMLKDRRDANPHIRPCPSCKAAWLEFIGAHVDLLAADSTFAAYPRAMLKRVIRMVGRRSVPARQYVRLMGEDPEDGDDEGQDLSGCSGNCMERAVDNVTSSRPNELLEICDSCNGIWVLLGKLSLIDLALKSEMPAAYAGIVADIVDH